MTQTNRFSLKRFARLGRFHASAIGCQTAIYIILSLLLALLTVSSAKSDAIILMIPLVWLTLTLMLMLGPLVFATSRGIEITTMLPATKSEKAAFPLLYTFIALPVMTLLPFGTVMALSEETIIVARHDMPAIAEAANAMLSNEFSCAIISTVTAMALCLFGVSIFRRHRTLLTILTMAVAGFVFMAVSMTRAIYGIKELDELGRIDLPIVYSADNNEKLFGDIAHFLNSNADIIGCSSTFGICLNTALAIISLTLIAATIRKISNRQL